MVQSEPVTSLSVKRTVWNFVQVCGMAKNMSSRVRQTWHFCSCLSLGQLLDCSENSFPP